MFNNRTRNQHFIAQVEQKLNAIDPTVARDKRRIYEFEIQDREHLTYSITNPNGVKIEKNLSFDDLYTFDIFSDATRNNFEAFFQKYESKIENNTNIFIEKIINNEKPEFEEIFELFFCKFMNLVRNPFSIVKVINTLGTILDFKPTDSELLKEFNKLTKENIRVDAATLHYLNVSEDQYVQWLKIIFNFFAVDLHGQSLGERAVYNFAKRTKIYINLFIYSDDVCLLSDRGYVDYTPGFENNAFSMAFNLNKNTFFNFSFVEISWETFKKIAPQMELSLERLEKMGGDIYQYFKPGIEISSFNSECIEALENYNSNILVQCHHNFYCAEEKFKIW